MRAPHVRGGFAYWLIGGVCAAGIGLAAAVAGSTVAHAEPAPSPGHAHVASVARQGAGARRAAPAHQTQSVPYVDWSRSQQLFTGRPGLLTTLAGPLLRALGPVEKYAVASPPWYTTLGLTTAKTQSQGMPVWTLSPPSPSGKVVVAIHGGAYRSDPTVFHWLTYAAMAGKTGATVVVPLYPLVSQGGTAGTVVPQMTQFLTSIVDRYGPDNVSVIGDSAGGGLALAAVQQMVQAGAATPGRMVLLSPWLDVTLSDPAIPLIDDPATYGLYPGLLDAGQSWAGGLSLTDPRVSPLYGSLHGIPPTTVYAGSRDIVAPDALRLREQASAQGVDVRFVLRAGEFHVWPMSAPLPDALVAVRAIYRQLGLVSSPPGRPVSRGWAAR